MKPSLEDERRALLEQIEASRSVYRKMLAGDIENSAMHTSNVPGTTFSQRGQSIRILSRSLTVRWVMDHPFAVAAGVAVLVWAAPSLWQARSRSQVKKEQARHAQRALPPEAPAMQREGTARALITTAVLLLRNPATLRTLSQGAGTVWHWIQQQRKKRSTTHISSRSIH